MPRSSIRRAITSTPSRSPTPRWSHVDVKLLRKTALLALAAMREAPSLATMRVLERGNRLSITPVTADEWRAVLALLKKPA